jgi:N6-adenosine-specific RNA methylase IME4
MSVKDIMGLNVTRIAKQDSHLYLWVTNNYLEAAFDVVRVWGFKYITTITWEKEAMGLGQYFRGTTEHVLFCRRGQPPYRINEETGKRAQGRTGFQTFENMEAAMQPGMISTVEKFGAWFAQKRGEHSVKPDRIHSFAELVSHGPRLEMFARGKRAGWDAWGLEAPKEEEIDPLS